MGTKRGKEDFIKNNLTVSLHLLLLEVKKGKDKQKEIVGNEKAS